VILLAATFIALVTVPLTGGRVRALQHLQLRAAWLLGIALCLQVAVTTLLTGDSPTIDATIHLASYALWAMFVVANRDVARLWIVALGGALNATAIALNGGVMPASRAALARAGLHDSRQFANSAPVAHAHVAFLGDRFAIARTWPLHNVYSIGDMLIAVGIVIAVHHWCRHAARVDRDDVIDLRVGAPLPLRGQPASLLLVEDDFAQSHRVRGDLDTLILADEFERLLER